MQRLIDANELEDEFDRCCAQECGVCSIPWNDASCPLIGDATTVLTLPDNPTNGDMLKWFGQMYNDLSKEWIKTKFSEDWWNAPYKGTEHE